MNINLKDLHPSLKGALICVLLLMPFWLLDIYLFRKDLLIGNFSIPVIISFCLSLPLAFSWITFYSLLLKIDQTPKIENRNTINSIFIISTGSSLFILSIVSYIAYYFWRNLNTIKNIVEWLSIILALIFGAISFFNRNKSK